MYGTDTTLAQATSFRSADFANLSRAGEASLTVDTTARVLGDQFLQSAWSIFQAR
jgi:hypothetical protein